MAQFLRWLPLGEYPYIVVDNDIPAGVSIVIWVEGVVGSAGSAISDDRGNIYQLLDRFDWSHTAPTGEVFGETQVSSASTVFITGSRGIYLGTVVTALQIGDKIAFGAPFTPTGFEGQAAAALFANLRSGSAYTFSGDRVKRGPAATLGDAQLTATVHDWSRTLIVGFGAALNMDAPNPDPPGGFFEWPPPAEASVGIADPWNVSPEPLRRVFQHRTNQNTLVAAGRARSQPAFLIVGREEEFTLAPTYAALRTTTGDVTFGTLPPFFGDYRSHPEGGWIVGWTAIRGAPPITSPPCLVRDTTGQLMLFYINADGALAVDLYDEEDSFDQTIIADDSEDCSHPSFWLRDGVIEGTYLRGGAAIYTRSRDHSRTFAMYGIPGEYTALTSQEHRGRIVALGFRDGSWYARVAKLTEAGAPLVVPQWGAEGLVTDNSTGLGHLRDPADTDLHFVHQRADDEQWEVLRCPALSLDGVGDWL